MVVIPGWLNISMLVEGSRSVLLPWGLRAACERECEIACFVGPRTFFHNFIFDLNFVSSRLSSTDLVNTEKHSLCVVVRAAALSGTPSLALSFFMSSYGRKMHNPELTERKT